MAYAGTLHILICPTPTRLDCHTLKHRHFEQGLPNEEFDLSEPDIAEEAKARTRVRVEPITIVGSEIFYRTSP